MGMEGFPNRRAEPQEGAKGKFTEKWEKEQGLRTKLKGVEEEFGKWDKLRNDASAALLREDLLPQQKNRLKEIFDQATAEGNKRLERTFELRDAIHALSRPESGKSNSNNGSDIVAELESRMSS